MDQLPLYAQEHVLKFFSHGVHLKNTWIDHIVEKQEEPFEDLFQEFLFTDIEETSEPNGILIMSAQNPKFEITENIVCQIDEIVDISLSNRDRFYQHLSSTPTLKLMISDGGFQMPGVVQRPIDNLDINSPPGIKISITPDAYLSYGVFILNNENSVILGGQSPVLIEKRKKMQESLLPPPSFSENIERIANFLPAIELSLDSIYNIPNFDSLKPKQQQRPQPKIYPEILSENNSTNEQIHLNNTSRITINEEIPQNSNDELVISYHNVLNHNNDRNPPLNKDRALSQTSSIIPKAFLSQNQIHNPNFSIQNNKNQQNNQNPVFRSHPINEINKRPPSPIFVDDSQSQNDSLPLNESYNNETQNNEDIQVYIGDDDDGNDSLLEDLSMPIQHPIQNMSNNYIQNQQQNNPKPAQPPSFRPNRPKKPAAGGNNPIYNRVQNNRISTQKNFQPNISQNKIMNTNSNKNDNDFIDIEDSDDEIDKQRVILEQIMEEQRAKKQEQQKQNIQQTQIQQNQTNNASTNTNATNNNNINNNQIPNLNMMLTMMMAIANNNQNFEDNPQLLQMIQNQFTNQNLPTTFQGLQQLLQNLNQSQNQNQSQPQNSINQNNIISNNNENNPNASPSRANPQRNRMIRQASTHLPIPPPPPQQQQQYQQEQNVPAINQNVKQIKSLSQQQDVNRHPPHSGTPQTTNTNHSPVFSLQHLTKLPQCKRTAHISVDADIFCLRQNVSNNGENESPFLVTLAGRSGASVGQELEISVDSDFLSKRYDLDFLRGCSDDVMADLICTIEKQLQQELNPPLHVIDKGKGKPENRFFLTE